GLLFEKLDGVVGRDVVDPTLGRTQFAAEENWAVVVLTLADEAGDVIEAGPLALAVHVEFAAVGGAVARFLQLHAERRHVGRHGGAIADDAVEVAVATGQHTG